MSALPSLAALLLAAAPLPSTALLPLEPLGVEQERADEMQREVRAALEKAPVRLLDSAQTAALLEREPDLAECAEPVCLARAADKLGVESVVSGVVGGLGGFRTLVLKRTDREGKVVTSVNETLGEQWQQEVARMVGLLIGAAPAVAEAPASPEPASAPPAAVSAEPASSASWTRPLAWATSAGAVASLAVAVGFGLSSRSIERDLESGRSGCSGGGDAYASCVEDRFDTGRSRATVANAFFGIGGALAVGSAALWLWPHEPERISIGPGPSPLGLSAHGSF